MSEPLSGKYLVLGSTGLAGVHTLLKLRNKAGVSVKAVYHRRMPLCNGINITHIQADLRDLGICKQLMTDVDYLFLFAGIVATSPVLNRDPVQPVLDNLRIYTNCLEAAFRSGVKKVVWLSSTTGYPAMDGSLNEASMFEGEPPGAWFFLGWMTRFVEIQCQTYAEKLGGSVSITALRPTMMYGEYDNFSFEEGHFLPAMIRRVIERQVPIEVWGTGEQSRDLVYAGDVVEAAIIAMERVKGYNVFNIASGKSVTINEVLTKIIDIDNFNNPKVIHLKNKPTTISKRFFSNEKAKEILGFCPGTSLTDGLRKTITWYRGTLGSGGVDV